MTAPVMAYVASTAVGGMLTAALTSRGLHQLREPHHTTRRLLGAGAFAGGLLGGVAVPVADVTGAWQLLPAYVLWGCLLIAAGLCDAVTQRVPTVLVRAGTAVVAPLFAVTLALDRDWQGLVLTATASVATVATLLVCWGLHGAGRGDVRLGLLGGLGLGSADGRGLLVGLLVLTVVVATQVITQLVTGAGRQAQIPLGPALAAGFISAAAMSALA